LSGRLSKKTGFTIVEVLISISIVSILITLVFYGYEPILNKAQSVLCMSQMRSIHAALAANLADKGTWPQPPENSDANEQAAWWMDQLAPYGISPKTWICPTAKKLTGIQQSSEIPKSTYAVSLFDKGPAAPYRWPTQPWLVEGAGDHPNGPHICFPDGSIQSLNRLLNRN
jgi:prepilin-type N-terminal cleavage/methylation domain-containing protein